MKNQRLTISIILIIFSQINSYPSDNGFVKTDVASDSTINTIVGWLDEVNKPEVPGGYSVGIIKDGKVLLEKSYGFANEESKVPFKSNTVFDFASIAKQFTGFAVARLVQMIKLSLDDDIRKYLPEIPDFGHQIKIRHLLNHTSGLRDWVALTKLSGRLEDDVITDKHIMEFVKHQKELNFLPGERHAYCNTGYFLLARIVEQVTQKQFNEWVKENIFKPLGMNSSLILSNYNEIIPNRADSYVRGDEGKYLRISDNLSAIGSSSLMSTMDDMIKWLINLDTKEVGGKNLFDLMTTSSSLNNGEKINYNFGLEKEVYHGREYFTHGGSWGGYVNELVYFPNEHLSYLFFSNRCPSGVYLRYRILRLLLNIERTPESDFIVNENRSYLEIDTTKYDKFMGNYAMKVNDPYSSRIYYTSKVFIMRDQLTASSDLYRNNHLFPISDNKFFIKGDTNEYEFFTDEEGNCYKYVIKHGPHEYTFLRMEIKLKI